MFSVIKPNEIGKGVKVKRNEPEGLEQMISHDEGWFKIVGWFNFLSKFSAYNYGVAQAFTESFEGQHVQLGNIRFKVTKYCISRAT